MARSKGTRNWKTLSRQSDLDVYSYFRTERRQYPDHAWNSVRMLRRLHNDNVLTIDPATAEAQYLARQQSTSDKLAELGLGVDELLVALEPKVEPVVQQAVLPDAPRPPFALGPSLRDTCDLIDAMAKRLREEMHFHTASMLAELRSEFSRPIVVQTPARADVKLEGLLHQSTEKVLRLALGGLNVMLVGPAGCGKTQLGKAVAQAKSVELTLVSCSAGMSESQLLGRLLPLGQGGTFEYVESPFVTAYRTGGVILIDEIDAADANLLLAINAALANGEMDIESRKASGLATKVLRHPETIILAAANTWGSGADAQYVGRGALDVATLDRFYRLSVDYDRNLERQLGAPKVVEFVHKLRDRAVQHGLRRVVSTRMIVRMSAAMAAGLTQEDIINDELSSWSKTEREKVAGIGQ